MCPKWVSHCRMTKLQSNRCITTHVHFTQHTRALWPSVAHIPTVTCRYTSYGIFKNVFVLALSSPPSTIMVMCSATSRSSWSNACFYVPSHHMNEAAGMIVVAFALKNLAMWGVFNELVWRMKSIKFHIEHTRDRFYSDPHPLLNLVSLFEMDTCLLFHVGKWSCCQSHNLRRGILLGWFSGVRYRSIALITAGLQSDHFCEPKTRNHPPTTSQRNQGTWRVF